MPSPLFDAVARCHVRRLRGLAAAAPLPAAAVATLVLSAPIALIRIGRVVGGELAGAIGIESVHEAVVLGPVLAAAMAGAALAVSLPGPAALGQQIDAGPCGRRAALMAGLVVPAAVGALAVLPSLFAACLALASGLPGGTIAGAALAVAAIAAVPAGAVAAEGWLAAIRGTRRRSLAILGGAVAWGAAGVALGAAALGPLAPVAPALAGSGSSWLALALALAVALTLGLAWVATAATRTEPRATASRPPRRLVPGGHLPVPAAVAALVTRRSDVRLAAVGAVGFGIAGIAIGSLGSSPAPGGFLLATTTALLGATVCSLAVGGALADGGWLWRAGPADRGLTVACGVAVGIAGSALPVVVVGIGAAAFAGVDWPAVGVVAPLVIAGSATALVAGAVVPWRGKGVGDQMATFAAFAAIAIAGSLLVGLVAPRLVAFGLSDAIVAGLVCAAFVGAAGFALGRRLEVPAR